MQVESIEFPSEGAILRGRWYRPEGRAPFPCVVMAHGTSATLSMVAEDYAEGICRAGISVLLYDHINFGHSGGEQRQLINPWLQGRGYRDAVQYLHTQPSVDPQRIALWGDSYSAMEVLVVGALIPGISAVVAQIPACGIEVPESMTVNEGAFKALQQAFEHADVTGFEADAVGPMPVVSFDQQGSPSLLKPIQAFRWFIEFGGRFDSAWENRATRVIPKLSAPFSPLLSAPYFTVPVLMLVGKNDEMVHCDRTVQRTVFERLASMDKTWVEVDKGHFGLLYPGSPEFELALKTECEFLTRRLVG